MFENLLKQMQVKTAEGYGNNLEDNIDTDVEFLDPYGLTSDFEWDNCFGFNDVPERPYPDPYDK